MCFRETVARLHEHGFSNTVLFKYGLEIRWRIITIENAQVRVHPRIIEAAELPEVLVTVDDHKIQVFSYQLPVSSSEFGLPSVMRSVPPRGSGWVFGFSICDCRLPISFYRQTPIRNRQLTIGNQETHPLPRGGTDLTTPRSPNLKLET